MAVLLAQWDFRSVHKFEKKLHRIARTIREIRGKVLVKIEELSRSRHQIAGIGVPVRGSRAAIIPSGNCVGHGGGRSDAM